MVRIPVVVRYSSVHQHFHKNRQGKPAPYSMSKLDRASKQSPSSAKTQPFKYETVLSNLKTQFVPAENTLPQL